MCIIIYEGVKLERWWRLDWTSPLYTYTRFPHFLPIFLFDPLQLSSQKNIHFLGRKILEGHLPPLPPPSSAYECNLTTQPVSWTLTREVRCCVHYPKSTDFLHIFIILQTVTSLKTQSPVTALRPLNSLMHKTCLLHATGCIYTVNGFEGLISYSCPQNCDTYLKSQYYFNIQHNYSLGVDLEHKEATKY